MLLVKGCVELFKYSCMCIKFVIMLNVVLLIIFKHTVHDSTIKQTIIVNHFSLHILVFIDKDYFILTLMYSLFIIQFGTCHQAALLSLTTAYNTLLPFQINISISPERQMFQLTVMGLMKYIEDQNIFYWMKSHNNKLQVIDSASNSSWHFIVNFHFKSLFISISSNTSKQPPLI